MWDTKSFRKPLHTATDLPSLNGETNVVFSPNGEYIITGTAGSHAGVLAGQAEEEKARELAAGGVQKGGQVLVLRASDLGIVRRLGKSITERGTFSRRDRTDAFFSAEISPFSVVKVLWNERINQIITGSSDGSIHVLYSPHTSTKGATLAVTRAPRARAPDDFSTASSVHQQIIAPHSLPMFKEDNGQGQAGSGKRKRERERHDPQKTMKPSTQLPMLLLYLRLENALTFI